jgi:hypothetical protein
MEDSSVMNNKLRHLMEKNVSEVLGRGLRAPQGSDQRTLHRGLHVL